MTPRHDVETTAPVVETADLGRSFFWCKCGRSFARPFCDGTHQGACACRDDDADRRIAARTAE